MDTDGQIGLTWPDQLKRTSNVHVETMPFPRVKESEVTFECSSFFFVLSFGNDLFECGPGRETLCTTNKASSLFGSL